MLSITLRHRFPSFMLDVAIQAPAGVTALFGPSGAGKSSVLMAAAGLLRADAAHVAIGDVVLDDSAAGLRTPPERRRIGVVFQDSRLFPHMTVAGNLRYGLRRAAAGPIGFADVVELLGIGHLLPRRPATLSGGEKQRVAIGRALLSQPRLLLMDEPLASLDAGRKAEILPYLARLKSALGLPILYVTHAMDEVARLADHLVLIEAGQVTASGDIAAMTARADLTTGLRDDAGAVLAATIGAHDPARQLTRLDIGGTTLQVPLIDAPPGRALRVRIPAREVILARGAPPDTSVHNTLAGTVGAITPDAARHAALVQVVLPGGTLLARVTQDAVERLALSPGAAVLAMVKSVGVDVLL